LVSVTDIYDRFYDDGVIQVPTSRDNEFGNDISDINDQWDSRIREWFEILNIRKSVFKHFYPFEITDETITLKTDLTGLQKLYIFLLLSANLGYMRNMNLLTSDFEELSLEVLKKYLPNHAEVHRFGKSMLDFDRYTGHIKDKINLLAEDLKYRTKYEAHYFADTDNGDGGLDIVAWIPFEEDENYNNIQVHLCQCATGKEWHKKQDDIDKFYGNYIEFKTQINPTLFIPYDGRNADRTFNEEGKIKKSLMFDRIRILFLLEGNEERIINNLSSFESIVDKAIEYEEDIV